MFTLWFAHLPKDRQEDFKKFVLSSKPVLDHLASMLEDKRKSTEVFKKEDYKTSSWAYEAADRNGYVRALDEILTILKEGLETTHDRSNTTKRK